ncbi:MAG: BON domain-containing protein [Actinomycetota bacterium]
MRLLKNLALIGIGAIAAYLLDPVSGRGRRVELTARARSQASDVASDLSAKARYEAGKAKGFFYETFVPEEPPRNEAELLQKIRSEAVGPTDANLDHVDIRVDGSVVRLVGPSVNPLAEHELAERISQLTGVSQVHNELVPAEEPKR